MFFDPQVQEMQCRGAEPQATDRNSIMEALKLKTAAAVPLVLGAWLCLSPAVFAADYDLVINGGRMMDPETMYDDIANVGSKSGKIAASRLLDDRCRESSRHPQELAGEVKYPRQYRRESLIFHDVAFQIRIKSYAIPPYRNSRPRLLA